MPPLLEIQLCMFGGFHDGVCTLSHKLCMLFHGPLLAIVIPCFKENILTDRCGGCRQDSSGEGADHIGAWRPSRWDLVPGCHWRCGHSPDLPQQVSQ